MVKNTKIIRNCLILWYNPHLFLFREKKQAKALLCGHEYLEVSDTYDSLVMAFDKVLGRKKRSARGISSLHKSILFTQ